MVAFQLTIHLAKPDIYFARRKQSVQRSEFGLWSHEERWRPRRRRRRRRRKRGGEGEEEEAT